MAYAITSFEGGMNSAFDEMLLNTNTAKNVQNVDISSGTLSTCKGSSKYKAFSVSALDTIDCIIPYYDFNTSFLLIAGVKSGVKKLVLWNESTGVCTQLLTGLQSTNFDYVNFMLLDKRIVILSNGVDNTQIYDGTTIRDLMHDGYNSTPGAANKAPKGTSIMLHYDRIWIGGDSNNPDSLYFSTSNVNISDPEDWTYPVTPGEANMHGGIIDVLTWDGGKIISVQAIFDDIIVFKSRNIHKINGVSPGTYSQVQVFASNGAIADKSVVSAGNVAYFMDDDGIYRYDGVNVDKISQPIAPIFKTLNTSYETNAVAVYHEGKYILAVPEGSSATNNLIIEYDENNKAFTLKRGVSVSSFCKYNETVLFSTINNYIYKYADGLSWDGSAIQTIWETGTTDLGVPDSKKSISTIYVTGTSSPLEEGYAGDIKLTVVTEKDATSKYKIFSLGTTNNIKKIKCKNKGRIVGFKIENVGGSSFNIKSIKPIIEVDVD